MRNARRLTLANVLAQHLHVAHRRQHVGEVVEGLLRLGADVGPELLQAMHRG